MTRYRCPKCLGKSLIATIHVSIQMDLDDDGYEPSFHHVEGTYGVGCLDEMLCEDCGFCGVAGNFEASMPPEGCAEVSDSEAEEEGP